MSRRSLCAKEPLIIGLFCKKWPIMIEHPLGLRHPVSNHFACRQDAQEIHFFFPFSFFSAVRISVSILHLAYWHDAQVIYFFFPPCRTCFYICWASGDSLFFPFFFHFFSFFFPLLVCIPLSILHSHTLTWCFHTQFLNPSYAWHDALIRVYAVATISRLLWSIGLFYRISSLL